MLKVAIIGTGFGSTQVKVFRELEGAEVVGICGKNFEKTSKIAKELGIKKVYRDYKELLQDKESNLVSIVTPNYLHKPIFLEALKYDKDIILEKPAGINVQEVEDMIQASKSFKRKIFVDHPMRFHPLIKKLKDMITEGKFGKVTFLEFRQYTNYVSDEKKVNEWFDDPQKGGGQVLNMGTHLIDIARFTFGMANVKSGNMIKKTVRDSYPGNKNVKIEHQISANFNFDSGVNSSFFNTTTSFGYKNFEIKLLGEKGIFFYDDIEGARVSFSNDQPLEVLGIPDSLERIEAGRSFVSKSFKFFAKELVDFLNGKIDSIECCTLREEKENLVQLGQLGQLGRQGQFGQFGRLG